MYAHVVSRITVSIIYLFLFSYVEILQVYDSKENLMAQEWI